MFSNYLVEVRDDPVGILIRQGEGYAFHALDPRVSELEGATFPDAFAATRAWMPEAACNGFWHGQPGVEHYIAA